MLEPDRIAAESSYNPCKPSMTLSEQFPVGLRVLVVDDDITCLKVLEQMLRRCLYTVTLCSQATIALKLLRERTDCFDMVLSDVHMPDMDGYKLLEHVGLEMDLPVIMMSADESTSAVMRGIRHGACDYLIKPIRQEELKNLWQHVARKRWRETKSLRHARRLEVDDQQKHGNDAVVFASSTNENTEGSMRIQKAKRESREDDDSEPDSDDPSSSKKQRVVWSVELHQQFVNVVNQLGLDKAVPKRILELMNVPGLTRENVASHLQKFRLYLKRLSGVSYQGSICNSFYGASDPNARFDSLGRFDAQAISASGQLSSQTLAALHAELLGYTAYDQPIQTQTERLRQKSISVQDNAQILAKNWAYAPRITSQLHTPAVNISGHGAWQPSDFESAASGENQMQCLTAKKHGSYDELSRQQNWRPALPESNRSIIVQPSGLVAPQTSSPMDAAYDSLSSSQVSTSSRNFVMDYGTLSRQLPGARPYSALDLRSGISSYPLGRALSPSISSCQIIADSVSPDQLLDKESYTNSGAVPSFPSRFAVEVDPLLDTSGSRKIHGLSNANCVKAEPDLDWGNANPAAPGFEYSSLNYLSHIL